MCGFSIHSNQIPLLGYATPVPTLLTIGYRCSTFLSTSVDSISQLSQRVPASARKKLSTKTKSTSSLVLSEQTPGRWLVIGQPVLNFYWVAPILGTFSSYCCCLMDLAECLELLRSSSTEKKLVGLLLVCKFIPAPESDPLVLRQICEAIGFEFLNRLLNTTGSFTPILHVACTHRFQPPIDAGSISGSVSFRGLALSVLSTFSLDAELVGQEGFIKAIPFFVAALDSSDPQEALDALRCLVGAAENCVAIEKLLACGVCRHVALSLSHNDAATPSTGERLLKTNFNNSLRNEEGH